MSHKGGRVLLMVVKLVVTRRNPETFVGMTRPPAHDGWVPVCLLGEVLAETKAQSDLV